MAKIKADKGTKSKKSTKKKSRPAGYAIPADITETPSTRTAEEDLDAEAEPKEHKKTAEKTRAEWLDKKSKNPYVKFKRNLLKKVDPLHHSIWIKFIKKADGKRCSGGMIVQNHTPTYIKLRNPYSHAEFSVQLKDITVYARESTLKDMKKVR